VDRLALALLLRLGCRPLVVPVTPPAVALVRLVGEARSMRERFVLSIRLLENGENGFHALH
jgi:hypothetical protein